jgi:hypothetical protein
MEQELISRAAAALKTKGHPFVPDLTGDESLIGKCYNCAREVRLEAGQLVGAAVDTLCPQPAWL